MLRAESYICNHLLNSYQLLCFMTAAGQYPLDCFFLNGLSVALEKKIVYTLSIGHGLACMANVARARVFLSKTLRNVQDFALAFARAYRDMPGQMPGQK